MHTLGRGIASSALLSIVILGSCTASRADRNGGGVQAPPADESTPASSAVASRAFDMLKTLEGRWVGEVRGGDGATSEAIFEYSVTAQGNAVVERQVIGDPIETTTIYYLDEGVLRVVHFCAAGNQPRMYLDEASSPDRLSFSFQRVTNLRDPDEFHMRLREIRIADDGTLSVRWNAARGQDILPAGTFRVQRVSRPGQ